jgi:carbon storage regulator
VLIITRRPGERIMLGDDITIHVMEIVGNSARVGIEAPKSLPVYREEIWAAVKEENQASARVEADRIANSANDAGARV